MDDWHHLNSLDIVPIHGVGVVQKMDTDDFNVAWKTAMEALTVFCGSLFLKGPELRIEVSGIVGGSSNTILNAVISVEGLVSNMNGATVVLENDTIQFNVGNASTTVFLKNIDEIEGRFWM